MPPLREHITSMEHIQATNCDIPHPSQKGVNCACGAAEPEAHKGSANRIRRAECLIETRSMNPSSVSGMVFIQHEPGSVFRGEATRAARLASARDAWFGWPSRKLDAAIERLVPAALKVLIIMFGVELATFISTATPPYESDLASGCGD